MEEFIKIYNLYYDDVYRFTYLILSDKNSVTDIVQNVFLTLLSKKEIINNHPNIKGWLFITAKNKVYDYNKKKWNREKYELHMPVEALSQIYHIDTIPTDLNELLYFLSDEELDMVKKFDYGFSLKEIAEQKNIKYSTIRQRMSRLKQKIRIFLGLSIFFMLLGVITL